jgi:sulfur-carrier protein
MHLSVQYFAGLAEQAGVSSERIALDASAMAQIYQYLMQKHQLKFTASSLKPVCNNAFVAWDFVPAEGDEISFLPPFSGG